jgi:proteasome lid subunit RPN8/RPN11
MKTEPPSHAPTERASRTRTALVLSDALRLEIEARAAASYPDEACGLLIGRQAGAVASVERVVAARNANAERARDRYDLDPADQLAAEEAARAAGLDVVGVWHSHPDHPARPSETDRAAAWERWSYVIVSVDAGGAREVRSWRLNGREFAEEEIVR